MRFVRYILSSLFALALMQSVLAQGRPNKDDAIAMVKNSIAYYKQNGREKTIADVNAINPKFVNGELYLNLASMVDGVQLAHPMAPKMVGKVMKDLKDVEGKPVGAEVFAIAASGKPGWVEYKWLNPVTKELEGKLLYVEGHDGIAFSAGIYK